MSTGVFGNDIQEGIYAARGWEDPREGVECVGKIANGASAFDRGSTRDV
jgi:hypothetical protein